MLVLGWKGRRWDEKSKEELTVILVSIWAPTVQDKEPSLYCYAIRWRAKQVTEYNMLPHTVPHGTLEMYRYHSQQ
ncbi:hypothetical protein I79_019102 [Cricetulus griseus]|uniref:Uncharacterized protein n=1 Tax=Cricetulus griseus TaxID=10029 RepID=G3I6H8_CRIGR|nr:hypothetical protein I79_019102 [Cricetulus griseus]